MLHIGIDISKSDFHAHSNGHSKSFAQKKSGFNSLIKWVEKLFPKQSLTFVMEATGVYHLKLACYLREAGFAVAVINPQRIFHHSRANMTRVVSDASSARNIWDFGVKNQVEGNWQPLVEEVVRLKFWLKQIRKAQKAITAISNQLQAMDHHIHNLPEERKFLKQQLATRQQELSEAREQAMEMGKSFGELMDLLKTIKGIGNYSALHLIDSAGRTRLILS